MSTEPQEVRPLRPQEVRQPFRGNVLDDRFLDAQTCLVWKGLPGLQDESSLGVEALVAEPSRGGSSLEDNNPERLVEHAGRLRDWRFDPSGDQHVPMRLRLLERLDKEFPGDLPGAGGKPQEKKLVLVAGGGLIPPTPERVHLDQRAEPLLGLWTEPSSESSELPPRPSRQREELL